MWSELLLLVAESKFEVEFLNSHDLPIFSSSMNQWRKTLRKMRDLFRCYCFTPTRVLVNIGLRPRKNSSTARHRMQDKQSCSRVSAPSAS